MSRLIPWREADDRMTTPESGTGGRARRRTAGEAVRRAATIDRPLRIVLYSHDTMGLGHMRRNLLLTQALAQLEPRPAILMIAGARELNAFGLPEGVDCLTLPALHKEANGQYRSRCWPLALKELIALRSQAILATVTVFRPDVMLIDNVPLGAMAELEPTLKQLRQRGDARCVLGLRDVLDDPATVAREWRAAGNEEAIRAYYDAVWVYGDPAVYDPVAEYAFAADIARRVHYTGYLDAQQRQDGSANPVEPTLPPGQLAVCLLGGGQDGAALAEAFVAAPLPAATSGVLLTGPHLPGPVRATINDQARRQPRLRIIDFLAEPTSLLRRADRIIAMGGYNTVGEVLSFEKHALIVPRVTPRREQLIRAERLRDLGLIDLLHPEQVTPLALGDWLARDLGAPPRVHGRIDLNGLSRLPRLLTDLLAGAAPISQPIASSGGRHYAAR